MQAQDAETMEQQELGENMEQRASGGINQKQFKIEPPDLQRDRRATVWKNQNSKVWGELNSRILVELNRNSLMRNHQIFHE